MTDRDSMAFCAGILFAVCTRDWQAGETESAVFWAAVLALAVWRWSRS